MNLLLLDPEELAQEGAIALLQPSTCEDPARRLRTEERLRHLRRILKAEPGDRLRVGVLGGGIGQAEVVEIDRARVVLRVVHLGDPLPARVALDLVLALPRPKFLGRILQLVATAGVRRLILTSSARVEPSFWESSVMEPGSIERHLRLGLEQGRDTVMPEVVLRQCFDDTVALLGEARERGPVLLAHGGTARNFPGTLPRHATVVVGPEGGWLHAEVGRLRSVGAQVRSLGSRPFRVETAVAALVCRGFTG